MREQQGMSQRALADAMTLRGFPWVQQTVAKAESGRQALRLREAEALARILETTLDRFTWATAEVSVADHLGALGFAVQAGYEELARTVVHLLAAAALAEREATAALADESPRVRRAAAAALAQAQKYGHVGPAVREGIQRYEDRGGTDA
jgi:transcriptional regulator with XRE-family HTH domain